LTTDNVKKSNNSDDTDNVKKDETAPLTAQMKPGGNGRIAVELEAE
jgi:hypothetical protein